MIEKKATSDPGRKAAYRPSVVIVSELVWGDQTVSDVIQFNAKPAHGYGSAIAALQAIGVVDRLRSPEVDWNSVAQTLIDQPNLGPPAVASGWSASYLAEQMTGDCGKEIAAALGTPNLVPSVSPTSPTLPENIGERDDVGGDDVDADDGTAVEAPAPARKPMWPWAVGLATVAAGVAAYAVYRQDAA